ncbi:hypothetical protein MtrunA17_Chr8g0350011 [Medicago truncatula]|uniref:MBD domain-containing protein n=1 Tax=Medicago truncatula TaxID=3880 RepID=G7LCN4_MEDTR|nr:uncharacterized protein LOC11413711 [Medicago truncatula]AET02101.1 hypothetical protein MTR_8g032290 [Medicago truncatula]RHN40001.1 hypothetical protein MtrunA17_Chr8g0350011 [Medicago truncatula]
MAPKRKRSQPNGDESPSEGEESPPVGKVIPTGWDVNSEVQKDGSIKASYCCPDTEQYYNTYRRLIRYVSYAKKNQVGPYEPLLTSTKIRTPIVSSPRKTSAALSLPGGPRQSSSDSLAADQDSDDDSKSSSTTESGDVKEDEESVPKKDAAVFTELGTDAAVHQNTQERRMSSRPKKANTMLTGFVLSEEKKGEGRRRIRQ